MEKKELLSFTITQANADDRKPLKKEGLLVQFLKKYLEISVILLKNSQFICGWY